MTGRQWMETYRRRGRAGGRCRGNLSREGADPKISGHFFKAGVQAVFIFGAEMWVLTPRMYQDLCSFHHRVARRITGSQLKRRGDGIWDYPPLAAAMAEAGFEEIGVNVTRRQNTFAQYLATQPIMDLCEQSVWRNGAWVSWRWWDQESLDMKGAKERAAAELDEEEETAQEETKGRE